MYVLQLDLSLIQGLSNIAWSWITSTIVRVKQGLKDQVDDCKQEHAEKKDKKRNVLENHRDMILNYLSKNGLDPDLLTSLELFKVIKSLLLSKLKLRPKLKFTAY